MVKIYSFDPIAADLLLAKLSWQPVCACRDRPFRGPPSRVATWKDSDKRRFLPYPDNKPVRYRNTHGIPMSTRPGVFQTATT
jgi:hypothetical protein